LIAIANFKLHHYQRFAVAVVAMTLVSLVLSIFSYAARGD
jgi:hypothetical protein